MHASFKGTTYFLCFLRCAYPCIPHPPCPLSAAKNSASSAASLSSCIVLSIFLPNTVFHLSKSLLGALIPPVFFSL